MERAWNRRSMSR